MSRTKAERHQSIHDAALIEFNTIQSSMRDERLQCLQDRRFYSIAGAQWEGPLSSQFENKPRFEVNKVHAAIIRIINEYRNNRITVDFTPKDGATNQDLADVCDGLYRADEHDSGAQEAYDNAFEEGVGGGMGAWRLRAIYEDEEDDDNDHQRIAIEPIFDADSCVFFDLNAKRQDKADATRCFVLTAMSVDAFKEAYNEDPTSWPKAINNAWFDWRMDSVVYVAEYYKIEEKSEVIHVFRGLDGEDMMIADEELEEDDQKLTELQATGFREVRRKRQKKKVVHKYIMSGGGILEDCGIIAGSCIPIVPFYAKRWYVDGKERCMGHVRLAKDAQRLANMLRSWLAVISVRSPISKPIFTPEQMAGHTHMWSADSIEDYPYLLVNPITDAGGQKQASGPIGYTKAPEIPPGMAALLQITEQDLQDILGSQQQGGEMASQLSGKAVELIQTRLDSQAFIYMSNLSKAMKRSGEIWLSMAKELLIDDGRAMKTVSTDGTIGSATLRQPAFDEKTGKEFLENDLGDAKFDVWVDVGPSSNSQRSATVRALTGLAQITQDPETLQVLTGTILANVEGEGLGDLQKWSRSKLVRAGVIPPSDQEKEEMQQAAANRQPDPNAQFLQAEAGKSQALAQKAAADTALAMAKVANTKADTLKTMSEIGMAVHSAMQPPEQMPLPVLPNQ